VSTFSSRPTSGITGPEEDAENDQDQAAQAGEHLKNGDRSFQGTSKKKERTESGLSCACPAQGEQ